jgi:hypothetical protein
LDCPVLKSRSEAVLAKDLIIRVVYYLQRSTSNIILPTHSTPQLDGGGNIFKALI